MHYFNGPDPRISPKSTKTNFDCAEIADGFMSQIDSLGYEIQMEVVSYMASRISGSMDSRIAALNEEKARIEMEIKHISGLIHSKNG